MCYMRGMFGIPCKRLREGVLGVVSKDFGKQPFTGLVGDAANLAETIFDAARLARKAKLVDQQFSDELDRRLEVLRSSAQAALAVLGAMSWVL